MSDFLFYFEATWIGAVLEQVLARIPQVSPIKRYQVINERLKNIVSEFDTYENMITNCRAIAHNL